MPDRDEIVRSLTGAWRLFLDRPDAMRFFDVSVDGFWRSFAAVVLILPAYALFALAERIEILDEPVVDPAFGDGSFLANKLLTLALDWITLPILLDSNFVVLHIEGEDKKKALAEAEKPGPVKDMPIRAFLRAREPIILYWCP